MPGCQKNETCQNGRCMGCIPKCEHRNCGPDGCGGSCGLCKNNFICDEKSGKCVCQPSCKGKNCGPDGCGGYCGKTQGICPGGRECVSGRCLPCLEEGNNCSKSEDCCPYEPGLQCVKGKCQKCPVGTAGPHCQFSNSKTCSGHGIALYTGKCKCSKAMGPNCQFTRYTTCGGHGLGLYDGSCRCDPGYTSFVRRCDVLKKSKSCWGLYYSYRMGHIISQFSCDKPIPEEIVKNNVKYFLTYKDYTKQGCLDYAKTRPTGYDPK